MNGLGHMHEKGEGVTQETKGKPSPYRRAADLGNAAGTDSLAHMCQVAFWPKRFAFRRSPSLESRESLNSLAHIYDRGDTLEQNRRKGL